MKRRPILRSSERPFLFRFRKRQRMIWCCTFYNIHLGCRTHFKERFDLSSRPHHRDVFTSSCRTAAIEAGFRENLGCSDRCTLLQTNMTPCRHIYMQLLRHKTRTKASSFPLWTDQFDDASPVHACLDALGRHTSPGTHRSSRTVLPPSMLCAANGEKSTMRVPISTKSES